MTAGSPLTSSICTGSNSPLSSPDTLAVLRVAWPHLTRVSHHALRLFVRRSEGRRGTLSFDPKCRRLPRGFSPGQSRLARLAFNTTAGVEFGPSWAVSARPLTTAMRNARKVSGVTASVIPRRNSPGAAGGCPSAAYSVRVQLHWPNRFEAAAVEGPPIFTPIPKLSPSHWRDVGQSQWKLSDFGIGVNGGRVNGDPGLLYFGPPGLGLRKAARTPGLRLRLALLTPGHRGPGKSRSPELGFRSARPRCHPDPALREKDLCSALVQGKRVSSIQCRDSPRSLP
jgi:hypothetical protein